MNREDLHKEFERIGRDRNTVPHKDQEIRHQVLLTELFIRLLNEYNESTSKFNFWLIILTAVLAVLTFIMTIKIFL